MKIGYKLVHDVAAITDDPQQLLVIDYNNADFSQVLKGTMIVFCYYCIYSSHSL